MVGPRTTHGLGEISSNIQLHNSHQSKCCLPLLPHFVPLSSVLSTPLPRSIATEEPNPRQLPESSIGDVEPDLLVDAARRRHGSLDGKATNVLPALLQQRDEVVDGQHDVANKLLLLHLDVADGDTHAENLLQLELDRRLNLVDLASEVIGVRDGRGELASCSRGLARNCLGMRYWRTRRFSRIKLTLGETGTEDTGDLLDQGLGSDEGIVLASKLLDELLVLVQLLEIVGRHGVDTTVLGTVDIVLVTKNATARLVFRCIFSAYFLVRPTRSSCWDGGSQAA